MSVGELFALGASTVAILGFAVTLYQLSAERRSHRGELKEREVAEAVKAAEISRKVDQIEKDLGRAYSKIGALETVGQNTAIALATIEVEIRTIRESQQNIERKLDGRTRDGSTP
ncbi:MAG: hypothetical protein IMZ69_08105 [Spirochaetes bacterium]|nr:hypothetical protein [Spirochaetota bacterium]